MFARWTSSLMVTAMAALVLSAAGCAGDNKGQQQTKSDGKDPKKGDGGDGKKELKGGDKHDGWWCQEHGIPEHLCSMCSDEVAAKHKKEGDWCKIHPDRAKSQCFKCEPELYKKFEAMYVAKYNKKPEPPPKEEFEK